MQVLAHLMYSKPEINSDSNYVLMSAMVRGMRVVRPDWHFVVPFPDASSGMKYAEDGLFHAPNVTRVPFRTTSRRHGGAVHFDSTWWDRLFKRVGFDVCWVNLIESVANVKFAGSSSYSDDFKPVVLAAHNYVLHRSLPYPLESMANTVWAQMVGASVADWNVWNSDYTRTMFEEEAAERLHPSVVASILARSSRIHLGTLEPDVEPVSLDNDNEVPVIAYNHRLQGFKGWTDTMEVLDELWREGVRFKLRYMSSNRDNTARIRKYPWVETVVCKDRGAYLAALKGCDLNTTNTHYETFCISAAESMMLGQPIVAPAGITFPEITGQATTGYPYLFNDTGEQKAMLRRLLTDADERRRWGRVLHEFVRGEFNYIVWAERYADLMERLDAGRRFNPADDARAMLIDKLAEFDGRPFLDWHRAIRGTKVNGRRALGDQSFPMAKGVRAVRRLGGRVSMVRGVQTVHVR